MYYDLSAIPCSIVAAAVLVLSGAVADNVPQSTLHGLLEGLLCNSVETEALVGCIAKLEALVLQCYPPVGVAEAFDQYGNSTAAEVDTLAGARPIIAKYSEEKSLHAASVAERYVVEKCKAMQTAVTRTF